MNALTLNGWDNFFVAAAGAAAALAGLLFVALSINLARIMAIPGLVTRAAETFLPLVVVLILSLHALVPGQSIRTFGKLILCYGGPIWLVATICEVRAYRARHFKRAHHLLFRIGINQPATATVPLAGLSLLCGTPGGGLYWLVPAVCFSFVGTMLNAWILLVEILR